MFHLSFTYPGKSFTSPSQMPFKDGLLSRKHQELSNHESRSFQIIFWKIMDYSLGKNGVFPGKNSCFLKRK